jgi:peptide deformylase
MALVDSPKRCHLEQFVPETEAATETDGGSGLPAAEHPQAAEGGHESDASLPHDPEVEARRDAALSRIRTFGDPALRTRARDVERFDQTLLEEVHRMGHLMVDALGVGLAATQLGLIHRVLTYRVGPDAPIVVVVNPQLEWASAEEEIAEEGCLSLPGIALDVERPIHIRVRARDELGKKMLLEASGLEARVIQHEMDHLDGTLIIDRATKEQRKEALRILREGPSDGSAPEAEPAEASRA